MEKSWQHNNLQPPQSFEKLIYGILYPQSGSFNPQFNPSPIISSPKRIQSSNRAEEIAKISSKCHICDKDFNRKDLASHFVTYHQKIEPQPPKTTELLISSRFLSNTNQIMEKVQKENKDHNCESCGESFLEASRLKMHIQTVHEGQKENKCKLCSKSFSHKGYLKTHMREIHVGHKDHKCESCGKSFSEAGN